MKILCLGNEFIKEDSFAKSVGSLLEREGFEIVNIKDSFELLNYLPAHPPTEGKEGIVILDVVSGINQVKELNVDDLKVGSITTAHDFDAGFFLKLLSDGGESGKNIKIIGIPMKGDVERISGEVKELLL